MTSDIAPRGPQAAHLTDEEVEARAELCYGLDQRIKASIRQGREALWETARALYEFDEANGWSAIGYDRLGEWLADPEIGMTRTTFYRLTSTWRELVVLRQLPEGDLHELDVTKVDVVLPAVKAGKTSLGDALEDVKALGLKDLRSRYYKRPDPGAKGPDDDGPIDGTSPAPVEDEPYVEPPVATNPADDVPTWGDQAPTGGTAEVVDAEVVEESEALPPTKREAYGMTEPGRQVLYPHLEAEGLRLGPTAFATTTEPRADGAMVVWEDVSFAPAEAAVGTELAVPPKGKLEAEDLIATLDAAIAEGARRQLLNAATDARRFLRMVYELEAN